MTRVASREPPSFACGGDGQPAVRRLHRRIAAVLLLVSLAPLPLLGLGAWHVFGGLSRAKSLELHRTVVGAHAQAIERYVAERLRALELIARARHGDELEDPERLAEILAQLNVTNFGAFVDLGVIDASGRHLAYVGPYDLQRATYGDAPWFRDVMSRGRFVSDVFLGQRQEPHCVLATRWDDGRGARVLRATINGVQLDDLVRAGVPGETGDAFVVDRQGRYQTPGRRGTLLASAPLERPAPHPGLREREVTVAGRATLLVTSWINDDRWMLVVQQDAAEVMAPVRRAMLHGALLAAIAVALIVATTLWATRDLSGRVARALSQRDALARDLLRSSRLAWAGELAAGVAHEINNPLAIISAEQTNLSDAAGDLSEEVPMRGELLRSVARCQRQIERCRGVTLKMLQFGRHSESQPQDVDLAPCLREIVALLDKQASVRNVDLRLDLPDDLPRVRVDAVELEQVLVNLLGNALGAIRGSGAIRVSARRDGGFVEVAVRDTGCGISPEQIDKIFQPFFTTKPPGQGTGLGLSVCYGLVGGWGGSIWAESEMGVGTTLRFRVPIDPAASSPGGEREGTS